MNDKANEQASLSGLCSNISAKFWTDFRMVYACLLGDLRLDR
jgi:hypothetical protein